jgi:hypothetical protein
MATRNWTGSTSTDWFTAGNWDTGVPTNGDDVIIGTTMKSPIIGGTPTITINTLTINGTDTLTFGDSTSGNSVFMTVTNGITLSGGGSVVGQAEIIANVTATGPATIMAKAVNGQNTPQLEFFGTITDTGGLLTLSIANDGPSGTNLKPDQLILTKNSSAHAVNFNGGQGQLVLQDTGPGLTVTIGTQMAVGAGQVFLAGNSPGAAVLTDTAGVTLTTGTILGVGKVNAAVTATGAATILTNGGLLELDGPITDSGGQLTLSIAKSGDRLLLNGGGAMTAHAISFNGAGGTLEVNIGPLTVGTQLAIGSGTVQLDSDTVTALNVASGITLSGGFLQGGGKVTGNLTGTGTVKASGGVLELVTAIGNAAGPTFQIANGSNLIQVDGAVGTGNTFGFLGANGELGLANDSGFNDTINAFNVGAAGAKTTFVDIEGHSVTISSVTGGGTTSGTITLSDGAMLHLTNLTSSAWFANAVSDGAGGTEVYVSDTPCFCQGTQILTERGEVAVEELAVGDRVRTVSGELKAIRWIGFGRDLVTRRNSLARPIIVRAGALADGVPARDLHLTHGHALYLEGVLIPVENLVNHRSILWDETSRAVEYYHIELDHHDLLIADGAAAESYYDAGNRAHFHNTRPGSAAGEPAPTCAPVLNGGAVVERVWRMLFARAGGQIERYTTDDPDLHLVVDGERCDPAPAADGVYRFALAGPPAAGLLLRSRSGVPSLVGITVHDHRRLGVAISRIELAQASLVTAIGHDAPLFFAGGCYPPEAGYSWTDGELALPARLFAHLDGPFTLSIHTERPGMCYPLPAARAAA